MRSPTVEVLNVRQHPSQHCRVPFQLEKRLLQLSVRTPDVGAKHTSWISFTSHALTEDRNARRSHVSRSISGSLIPGLESSS